MNQPLIFRCVTSRPISWKAIGAGLEDLELDDLERLESFVKLLPNVTMGNPGRVPYITFSYVKIWQGKSVSQVFLH